MDLIHYFDRGVYLAPDRDCMVMDDNAWTYREVQAVSMQVASALRRDGIATGTRVAVLSQNDPIAFMCVLGLIRAQMVWVPLNPRNSEENLIGILDKFKCEVLFYNSAFEDLVARARQAIPGMTTTVCVDQQAGAVPGLTQWIDGAPTHFEIEPADPSAVIALQTTGGTTGLPKGVMQTHVFYEHFISSLLAAMPAPTPPRFLAAAPMTHAAGYFCLPIFARGGTIIVLRAAQPLLIAQAIERYKVTDTILPPTVIYAMLAEPTIRNFDFSSMRYFWYGTAPIAVDKLREAIEVFGPCMVSGWGQSEAVALTFLSAQDLVKDGKINEKLLTSCGRAFPFTEVAVMDPDGKLLGRNESGELVARGNSVMPGYLDDPEATADVSRFGWHHTGDIGYCDDEGFFHIVDRSKDMIISGGFNIFPSEIEKVIFTHPAVEDCAVVGLPDEKWGEKVSAFVQLKKGHEATRESLEALCRAKLGSMKTPKYFEFRDTLPRSPVGKTLKRELRAPFWDGKERKV